MLPPSLSIKYTALGYNLSMSFLDNLEATLFPEEAGNGEIIQNEIPFEIEERLNKEAIEKYNERLKYMEEHGI
jgi:hypothetical protein